MNNNNIWILISLSLLIATVNCSCSATASATARSGGSFLINNVRHQIYDISIRNTGTETITRIFAFFGYPSSASLYQTFNYNGSTGEISNYGGNIFAGQSFNGAGFILAGNGTPTLAFITPTCGNSPTQGPTTPPTVRPTNTPTNTPTNAPTTAPTAGPTTPPGSCSSSVSAVRRTASTGSFNDNGVPSQIWDLVFTNTGSRSVDGVVITITPAAGTSVNQNNKWNLVYNATTLRYTVTLFGSLSNPGAMYYGAGFVIAGATTGSPVVAVVSTSCPGGNPTNAPTNAPPTNAPTRGPTNTPTNAPTNAPTRGPTNTPTNAPTNAPGSCSASVSVVRRTASTGSFNDNGVPSQIWDLVLTNTGSRSINSVLITISPATGTSVNQNNKWNLIYSTSTMRYSVTLFGSLSNPGAMYYGAGFVIAGATTGSPAVAIVSTSCN